MVDTKAISFNAFNESTSIELDGTTLSETSELG